MKYLLSFTFLAIVLVSALGAERPVAEIVDYGIYSGDADRTVIDTNSPTGRVLMDGHLRLQKQTTRIPARLKTEFGFRFVVHGKQEDAPVKLRLVYLYPEMRNTSISKPSDRFELSISAKPERDLQHVLWKFTEPEELVIGEWTFQVFMGETKILEKRFEVVKDNEK